MVTKSQKEETVQALKEKFQKAKSIFNTRQLGLSVAEITSLRKAIRPLGAEFKIAKNTLFRKAAEGTEFEELVKDLKGTTALVFCYEDLIAPAGKVKTFSKDNKDKIEICSALIEGQFYDQDKASKVAGLPAKEVLLSQIAGMLVQNTQSIAYILSKLGENPEQSKLLKDFIVKTSVDASSGDEGKEEK